MSIPPSLDYRRRIELDAAGRPDGGLAIEARLDDPEHAIELLLQVADDGTILEATLTMEASPLDGCGLAEALADHLEGIDVRDVSADRLQSLTSGRGGCFHAWELASPSIRFAANLLAMCRAGWESMHPPGPRTRQRMLEAGLDACVAFDGSEPKT